MHVDGESSRRISDELSVLAVGVAVTGMVIARVGGAFRIRISSFFSCSLALGSYLR